MASKVYFIDMQATDGNSLLVKLKKVAEAAGLREMDLEKKMVAIKMNFGDYGNLAFLRPNYVHVLSDIVKEEGGMPFLTDCNTLYIGSRKNAIEHLKTAEMNGFNTVTTGCPVIIGDGLKGTDDVEVPLKGGKHIETAKIGHAVMDADVIITFSHFKAHEQTGFGGALKNLGMGCASRRGKMELHTSGKPIIMTERCAGCKRCTNACAQSALVLKDKKMTIDLNKCVGCGRCIGMCTYDAIEVNYDEHMDVINEKIVEYAKAIMDARPTFHITIITDVSPLCDCHGSNGVPIIPNVGMLASFDPVALDKACVDLAQKQMIIPGSTLFMACGGVKPADILAVCNKNTHWQSHFTHAKELGMSDAEYELIDID